MAGYHILIISNMWPHEADPSYGSFVQDQAEALRQYGVTYDVLFVNGRQSRWNYLRAIRELHRRLRGNRYDLIHAHFGLAGWVARCQFRLPVIVTFHGDDLLGKFDLKGRFTPYGLLLRVSSLILGRLVSVNIVQSAEMKSKMGLDSAKVIPGGIDLDLFRPIDTAEVRQKLGLDPGKKFVLFAYNPKEMRKRYDLVEAAVTLARQKIPELEILHVCGKPHAEMPIYMNAADVFVMPSMIEGSPASIKEALATNLPIVTVDVGDTPELIGHTEGNYLVPRNAEAIAEKVVEVCRRGERARGREWVASRLAMEKVARRVVDVYAEVLRR